jgi:hypothetical protein
MIFGKNIDFKILVLVIFMNYDLIRNLACPGAEISFCLRANVSAHCDYSSGSATLPNGTGIHK